MPYYYALSDSFTGDNPNEHASGFANTKEVIAFTSKAERDEWLSSTKLLTAKPLTRLEAIQLSERINPANYPGLDKNYQWAKAARVYRSIEWINADGGLVWPEYVALKYSEN